MDKLYQYHKDLKSLIAWLLSLDTNVNRLFYDFNERGAANMIDIECWRERGDAETHVGVYG